MRGLYFITSFVLVVNFCSAQLDHVWNMPCSGSQNQAAMAVTSDPSGNVFVTGTFSGTCDFDPSAAVYTLSSVSNSKDIFVARYNSSGALQWAFQIGGVNDDEPSDIILHTSIGGVLLCGRFQGTVDFNPSPTVTAVGSSLGQYDGFFAGYSTSGALMFSKTIGSTGDDGITGASMIVSGDYYIGGYLGGTADVDPGAGVVNFVVPPGATNGFFGRYNSVGIYSIAKQITGTYSRINAISSDATGTLAITGCYSSSNDFDVNASVVTLTTSSSSDIDAFVARYANGTYSVNYAKQIGGPGYECGNSIIKQLGPVQGDIFVGGVFSNQCDFDPGASTYTITNAGQLDMFMARYDNTGSIVWVNGIGGAQDDVCYDLSSDIGVSTIYATGSFFGSAIDFDPSATSQTLTSHVNGSSFIAAYTPTGSCKFAYGLSSESIGYGINTTSPYLYCVGGFTGTQDFDFSAFTATRIAVGNRDAYTVKYALCTTAPPQPTAVAGPTLICEGSIGSYSVNPNTSSFWYSWEFPATYTGITQSNTVNVTFGSSGTMSVFANNSCGSSPVKTLSILVNPQPTVTLISSHSLICAGQSVTLTANGASTYTWSDNSNGTVIVVSPSTTTNYTVIGTGTNGCSTGTTLTQLVSPCANINEIGLSARLQIYPNPGNGIYRIDHYEIISYIEIYTITGKLIELKLVNVTNCDIDLTNEPDGIYIVRIFDKEKLPLNKKVIKTN